MDLSPKEKSTREPQSARADSSGFPSPGKGWNSFYETGYTGIHHLPIA
jgi:hypothetical protein